VDELDSISRRDSIADSASDATLTTGIGVDAELGFTWDGEACWASVTLPLEAQQNVRYKTIRNKFAITWLGLQEWKVYDPRNSSARVLKTRSFVDESSLFHFAILSAVRYATDATGSLATRVHQIATPRTLSIVEEDHLGLAVQSRARLSFQQN
jgi:hypothetical protein